MKKYSKNDFKKFLSYRLKYCSKELETTEDFDEVLLKARFQGINPRSLPDNKDAYLAEIKKHAADSRAKIRSIQTVGSKNIEYKLRELGFSKEQLTDMTAQSIKILRSTMESSTVSGWNLSDETVTAMNYVESAHRNNSDSNFSYDFMLTLLSECLSENFLIRLAEGDSFEEIANSRSPLELANNMIENPEFAAEAIRGMRTLGKLPAEWEPFSDSQILDLLKIACCDPLVKMNSEQLQKLFMETLSASVLLDMAEKNTSRISTGVPERCELAIAILLNLRATGKLPDCLEDFSNEELALMVAASEELNFYFDEAVSGKLTSEELFNVITPIILALLFAILTALLLANGVVVIAGVSVNLAVYALFTGLSAASCVFEAVDTYISAKWPLGLSETPVGVSFTKARIRVSNFFADLVHFFNGSSFETFGASAPAFANASTDTCSDVCCDTYETEAEDA